MSAQNQALVERTTGPFFKSDKPADGMCHVTEAGLNQLLDDSTPSCRAAYGLPETEKPA